MGDGGGGGENHGEGQPSGMGREQYGATAGLVRVLPTSPGSQVSPVT